MKIIFVRHGHPDYENDCLTELGHTQAIAAANRLANEKPDRIFSSIKGRAYETACHIAKKHNLDITKLKFMREIKWDENPWDVADRWVEVGKEINNREWQMDDDFDGGVTVKYYNFVAENFDKWLEEFGLVREGDYYRVIKESDETIIIVSHGGSSSVVISHIFNLPFTFVCHALKPTFTAITEVSFEGKKGQLTSPEFKLANDSRHII